MENLNYENEVIHIHGTICIVVDEYDNLYYVDNGGIETAYEIGEGVDFEDLTPFSELPDDELKNIILDELN